MALRGRSILLMEDNPVLSADLYVLIEDAGARVIGPFRRVDEGLARIATERPDLALLDVELLDGLVMPVAEKLKADGVPFVFYTARGSDGHAAARRTGAPLVTKSNPASAVIEVLSRIGAEIDGDAVGGTG